MIDFRQNFAFVTQLNIKEKRKPLSIVVGLEKDLQPNKIIADTSRGAGAATENLLSSIMPPILDFMTSIEHRLETSLLILSRQGVNEYIRNKKTFILILRPFALQKC